MRARAVSERVPTGISDPGRVGVTVRAGAGLAVAHRRLDPVVDQAHSVFKRTVAVRPANVSQNLRANFGQPRIVQVIQRNECLLLPA